MKRDKSSQIGAVFHGPVNIGGIGGYLADYQRKEGLRSDFVTWKDATMRQNHDFDLQIEQLDSRLIRGWVKFTWFLLSIVKYRIFHFYFGKTLLPFGLDLPVLCLLGKKIVMTYCGSDIRLISVEKKRNPYASLLGDSVRYDLLKKLMMHWQKLWCHKFIVARNLIVFAKEIIPDRKLMTDVWVHNLGFDIENCPALDQLTTAAIPVLVHAPSNPTIKGTRYVRAAIDKLKRRELVFEYKELRRVPNAEAQEIYSESDIIIDQFLLGGIGTLAFEGMGYGKPVVCYVLQDIIDEYMPDCPVWNATIDNLADRLEVIIKDRDLRVLLGQEGIRFVTKHLDRRKINEAVIDLYKSL